MEYGISIGNKIELEKIEDRLLEDPTKRNVYVSQVLDQAEDGDFLAAMPFQEGKLIPLAVNQKLWATFYTQTGLQRCKVQVVGRYKKDALYLMKLEQLTSLEKVQRREFFRFDCRQPIEYRIVDAQERKMIEEGEAYKADEDVFEWKKGIALDLSGGGMRFVSGQREEKNALLEVRFEIRAAEQIETIYALAFLLRAEQNANNHSIYDNRIEFWKLDNGLREKIIRHIFNEQRKARSKESGLE